LANVDTFTTNLERYIRPIVDEQRNAMLARHGVQAPRDSNLLVVGQSFIAVLHDCDTASDGSLDDVGEVSGAEDGWR
jgi:hypothetical protein